MSSQYSYPVNRHAYKHEVIPWRVAIGDIGMPHKGIFMGSRAKRMEVLESMGLIRQESPSRVTESSTREFSQIMAIQSHDREEQRIIHHWTMSPPSNEDWEMEAGAGDVVAACIPQFLDANDIMVHSVAGPRGGMPKYRSVQSADGLIRTPREVTYFVEHAESKERFVLQVETDRCGDIEISVYSPNASSWIAKLRAFAKANNHLRGQTFDLLGKLIDHGDITLDDVILTKNQSQVINRHIIGYARRIHELKGRGARGQRGVLLEGVPGCGKSMLLRAIANELEGISVCIAGPDQICRHGSIDVLKELIEMTAPCAVFIEEIDIFGADRRRGGSPGMAELMQVMDGLRNVPGVLWVGTTNRPEIVETALADRPGRFDRRLKFGPLPDKERSQLVECMILPQRLTSEALELATSFTDEMTGAQVRDLAETLRIISDKEEFDASDVREAWEDCGFAIDQPFGFANAIA